MANRIEGDLTVTGRLRPTLLTIPDETILNAAVDDNAGIAAEKLEHEHRVGYAQESATTAVTETRVVHVVRGATGDLIGFSAGCVVANVGNSTVTVDLLKNGTTVLGGAISIDSGDAARVLVVATFGAVLTLVRSDVLEIVVTATVGTGTLGKGVFASLTLHEVAE